MRSQPLRRPAQRSQRNPLTSLPPIKQQGNALLPLLILLAGLSWLAFGFFRQDTARTQLDSLARAREALIATAVSYRDTHPGMVFGYLRCPDLANLNGEAAAPCGSKDSNAQGRLPWKTLGLPPLYDEAGECLWYIVSGRAKNNPKTDVFNWDTPGQIQLHTPQGQLLTSTNPHHWPLAVVIAARHRLPLQQRTGTSPAGVCGGNNLTENYLETTNGNLAVPTIVVQSTAQSERQASHNDRVLMISNDDLFNRIQHRPDFQQDIDRLLDNFTSCLNNWPAAQLPATSSLHKGLLDAASLCPETGLDLAQAVRSNWQNNLLYARPAAPSSLQLPAGTQTGCSAVLIFGGRRLPHQQRSSVAEVHDPSMYLEGYNASLFPTAGSYQGLSHFDPQQPHAEVLRCIHGLPASVQQISFAGHIDQFKTQGAGASANKITPAPPANTGIASGLSHLLLSSPAGAAWSATGHAGCLWYPQPLPLASRSWRLYYSFRYSYADGFATSSTPSEPDRGYGHSLQFLRGDLGAPDHCGQIAAMGVLEQSEPLGSLSLIIETDVHRNPYHLDPVANHTAILDDGLLHHAFPVTATCAAAGATSSACRHNPAHHFEESPLQQHNQRVELHTGCDASCSLCQPAVHGSPGHQHLRVRVWLDCEACQDIASDLLIAPPQLQHCRLLPAAMENIYFGFTGGFLPAPSPLQTTLAPRQGVSLNNFYLGIE